MISRIKSMTEYDESVLYLSSSSIDDTVIYTPTEFWSMVQLWQTLCETVRTVYEMILMADRNEYMVEATLRAGTGPLQLPIHIEDLLPSDRRYIEQMERTKHQQWVELQLDPCIDFQILLSLSNDRDRFYYFAQMITRERQRLEDMIQRSAATTTADKMAPNNDEVDMRTEKDSATSIRKGAWFNDEYW
jgi:hypothetical protein